ncbi:unnamed protein product [Cylindrotheca closterium]|uniref:Prolyl 4-hydroxylase alpha subunit domain-containing protein n=1 Tax=Cylindrotheca closterium TaxID=2856 RepID=A0AAD2JNN2_9STRA|nr:unnamed protein product [Cylindrotheca closterium]
MAKVHFIETQQGPAWVIDDAIPESKLQCIDAFRETLELNSKRPTVDRRFFADEIGTRPMATALEDALNSMMISGKFHVFQYQRFLEYRKEGASLDPHTDGTKICDNTNYKSTHTLLLYLSDCKEGGETLILNQCSWDATVLYPTKPQRGRILLFPHACPHAGNVVKDVPKICLRAEVSHMLAL